MTTAHAVSVVWGFAIKTFWRQVERLAKWALVRAYWNLSRPGRHQKAVQSHAYRKGSLVHCTPRLTARERN